MAHPVTAHGVLPCAYGGAALAARMRVTPEDFRVRERLPFAADGTGQHVLLRVRKRGANTEFVRRRLAELAGIPRRDVGCAGLKDRHALAEQWFSVDLGGRETPDWDDAGPDWAVLEAVRHGRKLRRGVLEGNDFRIRLREVTGDLAAAEAVLGRLTEGVPNYFGAQRFGHDGSNLEGALRLFRGEAGRVGRQRRSLWLSAARAAIFNDALARRVAEGSWHRPEPGDIVQLAGTRSRFAVEEGAGLAELRRRAAGHDLHPTGPLWGRGAPGSGGRIRALECASAAAHDELARGLESWGMAADRRPLRVPVAGLRWWFRGDSLILRFRLPPGAYATSVIREVAQTS